MFPNTMGPSLAFGTIYKNETIFFLYYNYFHVKVYYIKFLFQVCGSFSKEEKEKPLKLRFYNENTLCLTILVLIHCFKQ